MTQCKYQYAQYATMTIISESVLEWVQSQSYWASRSSIGEVYRSIRGNQDGNKASLQCEANMKKVAGRELKGYAFAPSSREIVAAPKLQK